MDTLRMIEEENLDIRTITMGISLRDCAAATMEETARRVYEKITRQAQNLVKVGEAIEDELGIPIVNKRISVTPAAIVGEASGAQDYVAAANTWLRDRFLFGSAYPLMPIGESLAIFKSLFREDVLPRLLWKNASELFNIQIPQEETSC